MEKLIERQTELQTKLARLAELKGDAAEYIDKLNAQKMPLLRSLVDGGTTFDALAAHLDEIRKYECFRGLDFAEAGKPYNTELEEIRRQITAIQSAQNAKQQRQKYVDFRDELISRGGANMFERQQLDRLAEWMPGSASLERHRLYKQLADHAALDGVKPPFVYDGSLMTIVVD